MQRYYHNIAIRGILVGAQKLMCPRHCPNIAGDIHNIAPTFSEGFWNQDHGCKTVIAQCRQDNAHPGMTAFCQYSHIIACWLGSYGNELLPGRRLEKGWNEPLMTKGLDDNTSYEHSRRYLVPQKNTPKILDLDSWNIWPGFKVLIVLMWISDWIEKRT